jgi:hypothetical protein
MKAALTHFSDHALAQLGTEASRLVASGNLTLLHQQFGYDLAFDREPLAALEQDIALVLSEVGASAFGDSSQSTCTVSHFKPDETGLTSLVECLLPTNGDRAVLVELILFARDSEGHLTLEQISSAT